MLVVYGFHPEEPLAEEIGENLTEWKQEGVEVTKFRPSFMPDNLHRLPEKEAVEITFKGKRELRNYVNEMYGKVGFVLDLHETPLIIMNKRPQYEICFPSYNLRLRKSFETFAKNYRERVWLFGDRPKGFPCYDAAAIEYYSRIKTDNKLRTLSKKQGMQFAKDVIDHLLFHYLT